MTRGCAICGRQPADAGELPSGQPLCAECVDHWRDVRVYTFTGSGTVHLHDWCINIETTRRLREKNQYGNAGGSSIDPLERRFGQVPNHEVCRTCWQKATAPIDVEVPA